MEKVNVSIEEKQSLLGEANDLVALFEGCIKHLQKRIDFLEKKIESCKNEPASVETYTKLLSEGKKLMEDNVKNRENALCYLKELEELFLQK